MTEQLDGQMSLFGQDTWCGKMSQEPSPQMKGKTSKASSRKSSGSPNPKLPMCLCLRKVGGNIPGVYTMTWGGWSIAWRLHDAQFWGVPQRRKRIALVADFNGLSAPEVLFERKGLSGDSEPSGTAREEAAGAVGSGAKSANGALNPKDPQSKHVFDPQGVCQTVTDYTALCIGNGQANQSIGDVCNTISSRDYKGAQSVMTYQDCTGNLDRCISKGVNNQNAENDMLIANGCSVRRLTPLECERLQGFPDGWTDIGEWTDTNGKKHQPSDSPRYKALGNSIATPFWFYLLRRISAQYERPATLGSLFDGIGGFPYCWEMCNSKGTAVWASEIEEFPIAVTKRRFPENGCAEEQVCCGDSQNVECGDEDEIDEAEE